MDFQLLLPLAVLSVVSFVSFFVESFGAQREIEIASEKEDKLGATLNLLRRDIGEMSLGAGNVFVPFVILTLLGDVPKWIVFGAWFFVLTAIIRLPLVHFTRGREANLREKSMKSFMPLVPVMMLNIPLIIILYSYTIYAVVRAL